MSFIVKDIRKLKLKKFDIVVSLFDVLSFLKIKMMQIPSLKILICTLKKWYSLFDFWNQSAVEKLNP